jgi:hypothetical protein
MAFAVRSDDFHRAVAITHIKLVQLRNRDDSVRPLDRTARVTVGTLPTNPISDA